ncbi:acyl-CoA dehydrogenase family protein [Aquibium microcysteis]|uniref:acyl-CoA dehydrogenase family protein n=1 Tax=Aquibium microcysteis TaxID=675281 RepID=UPI00165CF392|nr:acyl-CoA dehydrogenase family protein [Aquibium microcysteis]
MELAFSPRDEAFRDEVRAFLDVALDERFRRLAAGTTGVFSEPPLVLEWQRVLDDRGWLVPHWPREAGGIGWSPLQRFIFEQELARAGAPTIPGMGLKLLGPVLCAFGTAEQKERYLPPLRRGAHFWAQGFSEPGSGSDLASLRTRAERDGSGDFVVNGAKTWTTMAQHATHIFCLARTDPSVKPQRGISFLLVDMNQPGVTVRPIRSASGDHEVNDLFLDNVRVPAADLVGEEGQGWSIAKFLLENERGGSFYGPALAAEARRLRESFDRLPGRDDPLLRDRLARIEIEAVALEMTELRIAAAMEAGEPPDALSLTTKLVASEIRQDVEQFASEMIGAAGLALPESGDERIPAARYLNSRAWSIFGGTSEIQLGIIARAALNL